MNHDFQQHVTSQAFVLTLSKPMIELLALTAEQESEEPWLTRLNASYALRRRGLIARKRRVMYITEEGKLVLELCRRAGLVALPKLRMAA